MVWSLTRSFLHSSRPGTCIASPSLHPTACSELEGTCHLDPGAKPVPREPQGGYRGSPAFREHSLAGAAAPWEEEHARPSLGPRPASELQEERAGRTLLPAASARSKSSELVGFRLGWGSMGAEATPGSREACPRGTPAPASIHAKSQPGRVLQRLEPAFVLHLPMVFRLLFIILLQKKG